MNDVDLTNDYASVELVSLDDVKAVEALKTQAGKSKDWFLGPPVYAKLKYDFRNDTALGIPRIVTIIEPCAARVINKKYFIRNKLVTLL